MRKVPLSEIFEVSYGNKLDFNKMTVVERDSVDKVNFVSRTSKNLGVAGYVKKIEGLNPYPAGVITVTLGGTYLLSSFIQKEPFYTAQNIAVLIPKNSLSFEEKLFYCVCISKNRFRYSAFGREANRTLKNLPVPREIPKQLPDISSLNSAIVAPHHENLLKLELKKWTWFKYSDLFKIQRGLGPRLKDVESEGKTPFVTSTDQNNGWNGWTNEEKTHEGNVITVTRNGSVGEAFYQPIPFCTTEDVHVFVPKFALNPFIALFLTTLIRKEKYRYNYGRKWGISRMNETKVLLPIEKNGNPDWKFMEEYMKGLRFSKQVK